MPDDRYDRSVAIIAGRWRRGRGERDQRNRVVEFDEVGRDARTDHSHTLRDETRSKWEDESVPGCERRAYSIRFGGRALTLAVLATTFILVSANAICQEPVRSNRKDNLGRKQGQWVELVDRMRKVSEEGSYQDGLKHGVWRTYDCSKNLRCEQVFVSGERDGHYLEFDAKGRLMSALNFRAGKPHGTCRYHYWDGRSIVVTYADGIEVSRYLVSRDGVHSRVSGETDEIVSSVNWDAFYERMDRRAPKRPSQDRSAWTLRVVVARFKADREYSNPPRVIG